MTGDRDDVMTDGTPEKTAEHKPLEGTQTHRHASWRRNTVLSTCTPITILGY